MIENIRNIIKKKLDEMYDNIPGHPPGKHVVCEIQSLDFKVLENVDVITMYLNFKVRVNYNTEETNEYDERKLMYTVTPDEFAQWYDFVEDNDRNFVDEAMFKSVCSVYLGMYYS